MVKLSDSFVRTRKEPGWHEDGDGDGLFLHVTEDDERLWVLRMEVKGKEREEVLGSYPEIRLREIREIVRHRRAVVLGDGVAKELTRLRNEVLEMKDLVRDMEHEVQDHPLRRLRHRRPKRGRPHRALGHEGIRDHGRTLSSGIPRWRNCSATPLGPTQKSGTQFSRSTWSNWQRRPADGTAKQERRRRRRKPGNTTHHQYRFARRG